MLDTDWLSGCDHVLTCEGRYIPQDTSIHCLTILEHGHTHEEFHFCVQIVFLHFNFLVLTLKSRYYFVYDICPIVHVAESCNVYVFYSYTTWFFLIGV